MTEKEERKGGIVIWHPSNVYESAEIGKNVSIGAFTEIGDNVVIGENTRIGKGCFIPAGVVIGKDVFIGPHVTFSNDMYPPSTKADWLRTFVQDGAAIGAGVCVRPGVEIGKNSLIGVGSVVIQDVPGNQVWVGNPARFLRFNKDDDEVI